MSILSLKPSQLSTFLGKAIQRRRPVLVFSSPGIGKSSIIEAVCADAGVHCFVMHPVVSDPTDFKGMPCVTNGTATFLPFGDLDQLITAKQPTACFFDDLGQASESVQAAAMQLILGRRINAHPVSDQVVFLAATNRRTDRAGVTGLLEPLKGRFLSLVELKADVKEWRKWADRNGVRAEVIAFLQFKPELLSDFQPTGDLTISPSPRGWEHVSTILELDLDSYTQMAAIQGAVGEGATTEFVSFLRVWEDMVSLDLILMSPDTAPIPSEISALCAVSSALAIRVEKPSMPSYCRYLERLCDQDKGEFAALSMKSCIAREPSFSNTPAYVKAMSGPIGQLMVGA